MDTAAMETRSSLLPWGSSLCLYRSNHCAFGTHRLVFASVSFSRYIRNPIQKSDSILLLQLGHHVVVILVDSAHLGINASSRSSSAEPEVSRKSGQVSSADVSSGECRGPGASSGTLHESDSIKYCCYRMSVKSDHINNQLFSSQMRHRTLQDILSGRIRTLASGRRDIGKHSRCLELGSHPIQAICRPFRMLRNSINNCDNCNTQFQLQLIQLHNSSHAALRNNLIALLWPASFGSSIPDADALLADSLFQ
eukprot:Gregarina_sp_Poly_1__11093@NODE_894_length_5819_cov_27_147253_g638_i0_p3_GENE_NODE_894_length_5819_cov_27_147253_g638_i0NODE_894_length_5819_cov_27_147253_g638_i0_p3_ORF_typecomplete_len252_score4_86zinc_ribbon_5/PF13719_6/0_15_NODE_894_length_5819_cov_27_147253_g638_i038854640